MKLLQGKQKSKQKQELKGKQNLTNNILKLLTGARVYMGAYEEMTEEGLEEACKGVGTFHSRASRLHFYVQDSRRDVVAPVLFQENGGSESPFPYFQASCLDPRSYLVHHTNFLGKLLPNSSLVLSPHSILHSRIAQCFYKSARIFDVKIELMTRQLNEKM